MIVSLNLLKQYVDLESLSIDEIINKLTFSGLEVEGISYLAKGDNLVIGQILEVNNHQNSDHLHVLKVDEGEYGIHQIVCGAPNVKVGLKVIVARENARLDKDVIITKSIIRGVESDGMCCSLLELGVDKSLLSEKQCLGIEELNEDAPVGETNVLHYLGLDDVLLDINVLANRSDVLSIYSLAKEVGALFHKEVNIPTYEVASNKMSTFSVTSKTNSCPQFAFRVVNNIKVKESPTWLKNALRSEGIRSINNVVDIGNYVMLLTGRPVHLYDLDKINTRSIVVRDDLNEPFLALDEKEYDVIPSDVVVTDGTTPLCLGGIMGGLNCVVSEDTKNVGIECATFLSHIIRHTSSRLGLSSDSSARFIKGINPHNEKKVINLISYLLKELCEADTFEEPLYYDVRVNEEVVISCSYSYINHRLGTSLSSDAMDEEFASLGIKIVRIDEDNFLAYPPMHRIDLRCDADLSEEIFRTIGLDLIKPTLPISQVTLGGLKDYQRKRRLIRNYLIDLGLVETLTYTLISKEEDNLHYTLNNDEPWVILNPMTMDHHIVRRGLLGSLLNVISYNRAHQVEDLAIFETSLVETKSSSYDELCIVLCGKENLRGNLEKRAYDYYSIAGIFHGLMKILGIQDNRYKIERLSDLHFHPGRSVKISIGKNIIGVMGEMHPKFLEDNDLPTLYVLDLNLSVLYDLKTSLEKMNQISKYPSIIRDYALIAKKSISSKEIIDRMRKASSLIVEASIFDIYEGENIGKDIYSIAIRLTYSCLDRTLKDEDISEIEKKIFDNLNNIEVTLRK